MLAYHLNIPHFDYELKLLWKQLQYQSLEIEYRQD